MSANAPSRSGANVPLSTFPNGTKIEIVGLVSEDGASRRAVLYSPKGKQPRTAAHLMHPKMDQSQNYLIPPLLESGYAVLAGASRWVHNDIATVHEKLLLDVAAGVALLRERKFQNVILIGNSGGGTLSAFYQSQASKPGERLTHTPAGDSFDLNRFALPAADGLALVGAHAGEAQALRHWIDPSVIDEASPEVTNSSLDMYDERNGFQELPEQSNYDPAFLAAYRAAQLERIRRLDQVAHDFIERRAAARKQLANATSQLERTSQERDAHLGRILTIYRTEADPAFVDLSIEPDDRPLGAPHSLRPDLANYGSSGFARVVTPQAWLSTWSALSTNADTARCLETVNDPLLYVHYAGDTFTRRSQSSGIFTRASSNDKTYHEIRNVDHYGFKIVDARTRGDRTPEASNFLRTWLEERFPA
jgi:pimeloyl-ACP methyl ester carboxylesterase